MSLSKIDNIYILFIVLSLGISLASCLDKEHQPPNRVLTEVDEGSCICGLDKNILDKIESIVKSVKSSECSIPGSVSQIGSSLPGIEPNLDGHASGHASHVIEGVNSIKNPGQNIESSIPAEKPDFKVNSSVSGVIETLTNDIEALQSQLANLQPTSMISNHNAAHQENNTSSLSSTVVSTSVYPSLEVPSLEITTSTPATLENSGHAPELLSLPGGTSQTILGEQIVQTANPIELPPIPAFELQSLNGAQSMQQQRPQQQVNSGFIAGLPESTVGIQPSSSQSGLQNHKIEAQEVQNAVVSTVPNVVSNIFTNIQDLAIQAGKHPASGLSNQLTSIDGSSTHLGVNDTVAQIIAQGEQLFLQWIEHQIQAYHMTTSMASYIRNTALNLFRKIAKQYVHRIERVGGTVQNNVRQATQLALNNTQNLISFLLRNYLSFAGGLMRIIGEQVSRVGKQLDSTGETIAEINLNPFDIVSNVLASLPNPTRYSEYFRAFGKYLMGESSNADQDQHPQEQDSEQNRRRGGIFSKTMGALSKTLGSWIG